MSSTIRETGGDPIVLRLTTGLSSPLQVAGILNSQFTGTNLATGLTAINTITDSDSLILAPARRTISWYSFTMQGQQVSPDRSSRKSRRLRIQR